MGSKLKKKKNLAGFAVDTYTQESKIKLYFMTGERSWNTVQWASWRLILFCSTDQKNKNKNKTKQKKTPYKQTEKQPTQDQQYTE